MPDIPHLPPAPGREAAAALAATAPRLPLTQAIRMAAKAIPPFKRLARDHFLVHGPVSPACPGLAIQQWIEPGFQEARARRTLLMAEVVLAHFGIPHEGLRHGPDGTTVAALVATGIARAQAAPAIVSARVEARRRQHRPARGRPGAGAARDDSPSGQGRPGA